MQAMPHLRGLVAASMMIAAGLGNTTGATEPFSPGSDGWKTWRTEAVEFSGERCCFRWTGAGPGRRACDLDRSRGNYGFVDGFANYTGEVQVYVFLEAGTPRKVTVLSPQCEVRTKSEIDDLGAVAPDTSVAWLEQYIRADSRLTSDVLAAISQHGGDRSLEVLIGVVESMRDDDVRKEAVFWLVQSESKEAFEYLDRLLTGT